jgi:twitching motility two-component system response regulator PilG
MTKIVEALKDIIQQELSGKLTIKDALDSSLSWEAYFGNGKLHFATSKLGQRERLIYLARCHHPDFNLSEFNSGQSINLSAINGNLVSYHSKKLAN